MDPPAPEADGKKITLAETVTVRDADGSPIHLTYRFSPMSAQDLRVMHAVAALADAGSLRGIALAFNADDFNSSAVAAWEMLGGDAARPFHRQMGLIRTSKRQIAEAIYPNRKLSSKELDAVYESLKVLAEVIIHARREVINPATGKKVRDQEFSTRLIAPARDGNQIAIAINPRMLRALSRVPGAYSLLSMNEQRMARSKATMLLLSRLSAIVDHGKAQKFGIETLESYLWLNPVPDDAPSARHKQKTRWDTIKLALREIRAFGWDVTELPRARKSAPVYLFQRNKMTAQPGLQGMLPLPAGGAG